MPETGNPTRADQFSVDDAYLLALGKLVVRFSMVEVTLGMFLSQCAGVSLDMGKALYPGIGADAAKNTILRALECKKEFSLKAELEPIFNHLGVLLSVRNGIFHSGVHQDPEIGTKIHRHGHIRDRDVVYPISAKDIEDIAADLFKIQTHLLYIQTKDVLPEQILERDFRPFLQASWRYKQSRQGKRNGGIPKARPKRTTQPRSSPG